MSLIEIGCCGAYCGTCKVLKEQLCKGCKLGYENNKRDITKAKCKIKVCCISKNYNSCADCPDTSTCQTIIEFYEKKGYKYAKYKQAIEFIKHNGYDEFIKIADTWTNAYGKY
ncbi:DUF3795 domain-containing protein [uncultured Methanomethylovorans sp.]|uniref:DUF3795 domain-containing protein n=1 Tax=uncultured Methanomethylovorans sp. TaxID=183759 RepID=UPI002AA830B7|nr:DUF3795 domain-containing protein [uncultured Methanomethylovorans sp.]